MKLFNALFMLSAATIALAIVTSSLADASSKIEEESESSLRGFSRFLAPHYWTAYMTCNKYPSVCRMKNSPGPDCCKKKCVNVKSDRFNCGMCGYRCKYTEVCCKGKCVNIYYDKRNCGGCYKKCRKGEYCAYGMCNYA
ncbi:hypothetical protein HN51_002815 [Arachis hypogaea]|nr:stigma-specific STIG1-like protein 1 [Arachis hypogaea]QHO51057.1 Stigma-specific STIG1-like protein [Arachis hypogaea]